MSEQQTQRREADSIRVLTLTGVRGGETRTFRAVANIRCDPEHLDSAEPRDEFDRVWRSLTGDGWRLTIARVVA